MNFDFDQSRPSTNSHQLHHNTTSHAHTPTSQPHSASNSSALISNSSTGNHHPHHHLPEATARRIRLAARGSSLDTELASAKSAGASLEGGIDIVDSQDDLLYTIQIGRNLNQIDAGAKFRAVSSLSENAAQVQKASSGPGTGHHHPHPSSHHNQHHAHNNSSVQLYGGRGATLPANSNNLQRVAANGQSKSAMSFRFSTDEISQFRNELGSSVGDLEMGRGGCSTRATTPGEEMIVQEPVESLQVRIGRLLSSEEMADMHFLVSQCPSSTPGPESGPGPGSTSPNGPNRKLRIPAHRIIMATASPYFREMLLNPSTNRFRDRGEDDAGEDCIEITGIDAGSFLEFLRFAYTDSVRMTKDNCIGVLVSARRYEMSCLEPQCVAFIQRCLTKKSCLAIWIHARQYGDSALEKVALRSVQHFAEEVLLSNDFLKLDQSSLFELLSDDALRADEVVIFRALTRWAKQHCLKAGLCPNRTNVRAMIGSSLNLIRFPLMTEEQLQRIVAAEGILEDELLRALVHTSKNWSKIPGTTLHSQPVTFSSEPRTYQKLCGNLLHVYRFGAWDGSMTNRITTRSLYFQTNKRVWLSGVGLYAPRKACTFYLNVWVRVQRSNVVHGGLGTDQSHWTSPLDHFEHTVLLKYDGSDHIISVHFDEPLQVEANVQYTIVGSITPTARSTSLVKAKLHPHLYYTRPNDVNFYYGTDGQYATKVKLSGTDDSHHRQENVIFNFDWERTGSGSVAGNDDSSDSFGSNNGQVHCFGGAGGGANSEPSTPAPPPRPPPPQAPEYIVKRPSRMQRLRRAFSFIDRRDESVESPAITGFGKLSNGMKTGNGNAHSRSASNWDASLLEGQIPMLMFYA